jgi:hypothetical protein
MPDRSKLGDLIVTHGPYEPYELVPPSVMRFIESDQLNALRAELIQLREFQTAVMGAVEQLPYASAASDDPQPLPLSVGRIPAYCGRVERPHAGHVWNTSVERWCPGDEVPGRPEPHSGITGS